MKSIPVIGRIACLIVGAVALIQGFTGDYIAFDLFKFLHYFTYLSNVIVMVVLALLLTKKCRSAFFMHATVYITVTFLVYGVLLSPGIGKENFESIILHFAVPIYCIVDFFILSPPKKLSYISVCTGLFLPLGYFLYILVYGLIRGSYPYFFVDVAQIGYAQVLLSAVGITGLLLALGGLFVFINNIRVYRQLRRNFHY